MRRIATRTLIVLALVLLGTTPSLADKYGEKDLVGTWVGDVLAMMKATGALEEVPPGFDMSAMLAGIEIRMTFHEDGTVTSYNKDFEGEKSQTDPFEVVSVKDDTLTLKSVDGETEVEETITIRFIDRDNMQLEIDEEGVPPMAFSRAPEKPEAKTTE